MQVAPGAGRRTGAEASYGTRRDDTYGDVDEEGDLEDPLSAFQRQQQEYGRGGSSSGAVRARHDVLTSSSGRSPAALGSGGGRQAPGTTPAGPRMAWAGGSRGSSPSNSRPASPSPGSGVPASYGTAPGRYASPSGGKRMPSSGGAGATGSVSSNLSVNSINSAGSSNAQPVGTGTTSSSRVYRHGSPAPNRRPAGASALGVRGIGAGPGYGPSSSAGTGAGTGRQHILASSAAGQQAGAAGRREGLQGGSIANSSVSSLGSGIVGAGVNGGNTAPRTAPVGGRYASPSPSASQQQPAGVRRSSNASAASLYSAESLDPARLGSAPTRRGVGSSPLRGTAGAPVSTPAGSGAVGLSSSGGSARRYATPTPQSAQDFDSTGSAGSHRVRSSTPTKATWKF